MDRSILETYHNFMLCDCLGSVWDRFAMFFFEKRLGATLALKRRFQGPNGAKLTSEQRFGRLDRAKLVPERCFAKLGDPVDLGTVL